MLSSLEILMVFLFHSIPFWEEIPGLGLH